MSNNNEKGRRRRRPWFLEYERSWLGADLLAGLVAAAVVIPKAMAFATIAGLPVEVGLYTAFVPLVIYAVLGTSRPLSVSTTTTIAILVAAQLAEVAPNGSTPELVAATATLAVLVGAVLVLASVLRLGFVANFISEPVLTGFKSGIGVVIVVDQIPKLLGIHIEKSGFFRNILAMVEALPETSLVTLGLAAGVFVLIFVVERVAPRVPAPLVGVGIGIAASALLGLPSMGVETVGAVPRGLPSLTMPNLDLVLLMWPGAVGIALMSFTESIAAARAFAGPDEPRPRPNRELVALGAANIVGGLLGTLPAGGGTSQTAVNRPAVAGGAGAGLGGAPGGWGRPRENRFTGDKPRGGAGGGRTDLGGVGRERRGDSPRLGRGRGWAGGRGGVPRFPASHSVPDSPWSTADTTSSSRP